ncbi:MAG: response regulator [Arcobacteraceae bacterium]|nr:response regulator [Arcobacteraceae bacterium]
MAKDVLFVDDSKTVLVSVEMALEELVESGDINFNYYSNPVELLDAVKRGTLTYDLLFTDINMPEMNGLELAQNLKAIDSIKNKPIIALTTESSPEMKQKGKSIGIAGWVVKPFSDKKIVMAVKKILGI